MATKFSKIQWGDGLTVTPDPDDPHVIRVDGTGGTGPEGPEGPEGPPGPTGPAGADGVGVPAGGTSGQVLTKDTTTDYDTSWQTPSGGGGGSPTGTAGGVLDGTYPNPGLAASVAGAGLSEASDVLAVNVDGSTLEIASDTLRVKDGGITTGKLAFDVATQTELDAAIAGTAINWEDVGTGAVGTITQPALGARVYNNADQSIANNTDVSVAFNSERFDTDSCHSTSVNNTRLTAQTAGVYVISGSVRWAANTTGLRQLQIILNGTEALAVQRDVPPSPWLEYHTITTIYKFAVGDYVELSAKQDSGAALNIDAVGNYSPEFSMVLVGH